MRSPSVSVQSGGSVRLRLTRAQLSRIGLGERHVRGGAQKLVPTVEAARERIYGHSLKLEDARAYAAYGQNSFVGKTLEIHQELPGRIHAVLIRQAVGL